MKESTNYTKHRENTIPADYLNKSRRIWGYEGMFLHSRHIRHKIVTLISNVIEYNNNINKYNNNINKYNNNNCRNSKKYGDCLQIKVDVMRKYGCTDGMRSFISLCY